MKTYTLRFRSHRLQQFLVAVSCYGLLGIATGTDAQAAALRGARGVGAVVKLPNRTPRVIRPGRPAPPLVRDPIRPPLRDPKPPVIRDPKPVKIGTPIRRPPTAIKDRTWRVGDRNVIRRDFNDRANPPRRGGGDKLIPVPPKPQGTPPAPTPK
jgi:hypothetical protein